MKVSTIAVVLIALIVGVVIGRLSNEPTVPPVAEAKAVAQRPAEEKPAVSNPAEPSPVAAKPIEASNWVYRETTDQMTGKTIRTAVIESQNTINLDFPYQGSQHARLLVRNHPQHGLDVIFQIEKGQLLCHDSFGECSVVVRFDKEKPANVRFNISADNDSTVIFVANGTKFFSRLKTAKEVAIQPIIYQGGSPTLIFNTANLTLN
jgi:hypothetical protein